MKVKTSSWHYRLWRFGRESSTSRPRDLCRYFWHLFLVKIVLPLILAGFVLVGIGALLYLIWNNPTEFAVAFLGILLVIALGIGTYFVVRKLEARHVEKRRERTLELAQKEPSVFREFLKARKRKMCPLIEVTNDTADEK